MTIYNGWFKTDDGDILLSYDSGGGDEEKRKANFIEAAAKAELETGVTLALNDEGRRCVDEAKQALQIATAQPRLI